MRPEPNASFAAGLSFLFETAYAADTSESTSAHSSLILETAYPAENLHIAACRPAIHIRNSLCSRYASSRLGARNGYTKRLMQP